MNALQAQQITISFTLKEKEQEGYETLLDFLLSPDIFGYQYCGDWATAIFCDENDFFVWCEVNEEVGRSQVLNQAAMFAFTENLILPTNYYRLNKAVAEKAIHEAIKEKGVSFLEDWDADNGNRFMQIALFDKVIW